MPDPHPAHRVLTSRALTRGGVFALADVAECGLSEHQFRRGVADQQWVPYRGVWILTGSTDGELSRAWAAILRSSTHAVITGPTALRVHRLDVAPSEPTHRRFAVDANAVCLSVPSVRHSSIPGVVYLREKFPIVASPLVDLLPTAPRARAVIDSIRLLGWFRAKNPTFRAIQLKWLDADDLANATVSFKGRRGIKELRLAAEAVSGGTHADSEARTLAILRGAGFHHFLTNHPVSDRSGFIGYLDFAFVAERIAIEVDGYAWHSTPERFQHDRTRQNRLVNAGWLVLRFTWDDLTTRPGHVTRTIRSALSSRFGEIARPAGESHQNWG